MSIQRVYGKPNNVNMFIKSLFFDERFTKKKKKQQIYIAKM